MHVFEASGDRVLLELTHLECHEFLDGILLSRINFQQLRAHWRFFSAAVVPRQIARIIDYEVWEHKRGLPRFQPSSALRISFARPPCGHSDCAEYPELARACAKETSR